jgi:hypothetical protein
MLGVVSLERRQHRPMIGKNFHSCHLLAIFYNSKIPQKGIFFNWERIHNWPLVFVYVLQRTIRAVEVAGPTKHVILSERSESKNPFLFQESGSFDSGHLPSAQDDKTAARHHAGRLLLAKN